MRSTTDANPTRTTCTTPGRSPRPSRSGAALSVGVGAAAVAALLAPAVGGQSGPITASAYVAGASAAVVPDALSVSDREAAAERSASRASRSGARDEVSADATAQPATAETATPASDETATSDVPASLAAPELESDGKRYTTTDLNVRLAPEEDAEVVKVLKPGTKVTITDVAYDGWQQIIHSDQPRWVKSTYLSTSKPEPKPAGPSSAPCASGSGVEGGLTANTIAVHRAVCNAFPSVSSYGGLRGGGGNHGSGRALDIMVTGSTGDAIAQYVRANAARLGVTEVIWEQRIWTTQRAGDGWRAMSDRGSATANHYDHVHVSTR